VIKRCKQFLLLPAAERRWFWLCWWQFAKWHLIIQFLPYRKWKGIIFKSTHGKSGCSLQFSLTTAIQLSEMAARNHLFRINCLRRCLVQQQLLARYGYTLNLHFGVKKQHGTLKAHCWLTYQNKLVNDGEEVVSTYAELKLAEHQSQQIIHALK
jgi:hypothetical protein